MFAGQGDKISGSQLHEPVDVLVFRKFGTLFDHLTDYGYIVLFRAGCQ
jgi:hypothetical protein